MIDWSLTGKLIAAVGYYRLVPITTSAAVVSGVGLMLVFGADSAPPFRRVGS